MANAGNLTFNLELDRDLFRRQLAQTGREAQSSGRASGAGYGRNFSREADLGRGVDRGLRLAMPYVERQARQHGTRYTDAFGRNCRPEVAVRVDTRDAHRAADTLQSRFNSLGGGFQSIMAGATAAVASSIISVIGGAISNVTSGIKSLVGEIYKVGTAAEGNATSLSAMVGSASKASKLISDIQKFSAATPFTSGQLVGSAKGLLASVAPENMVNIFKQIGNAAAVAKKEGQDLGVAFQEVAQIYGKINNKGKVTAEEMNQLTERGIVLQGEIAKVLGVQVEQVAELMEKGKVTDAVFNQAFKNFTVGGGLATGQMDALSKTTEGLLSTLQEGFQQAGVQIFKYIQPALNEVIKQLGESLAEVGKNSTAMTDLGKIANKFTEYLKQNPQIIQKITELAVQLLDDGMKQLVIESDKLLTYLKENPQWVEKTIEQVKGLIKGMGEVVAFAKELGKLFMDVVNILDMMGKKLTQFGEVLAGMRSLSSLMDGSDMSTNGGGGVSVDAGEYTVRNPSGSAVEGHNDLHAHHDYQTTRRGEVRDFTLSKGGKTNVPVPSAVAGTVKSADWMGGYGNAVVVVDSKGQEVLIGHMAKLLVKAGDKVGRGQSIGIQGSTGNSTGVHVHIEAPKGIMKEYVNSLASGDWGADIGDLNDRVGSAVDNIKQIFGGGMGTLGGKTAKAAENRARFLGAIRQGESSHDYNAVGVQTPAGKARGAYQVMPGTRKAIKNKYGADAWSHNNHDQDKAALAWIEMYGKEKGVDIFGMIDKGDFKGASRVLGKNQWTSLPGGAEQSQYWRTNDINKYSIKNGQGGATVEEIKNEQALQALKLKHEQERAALSKKNAAALATFVKDRPANLFKEEIAAFKNKQAGSVATLDTRQANQVQAMQLKQTQRAELDKVQSSTTNTAAVTAKKKKEAEDKKKEADEKAKLSIEEYKHLQEDIAKGLEHSKEDLVDAQTQLGRLSQGKSALDPEIESIKTSFESYRERIGDMLKEQRELLDSAKDPKQKQAILGNITSLDSLVSASHTQEKAAIQVRQQAIMMEVAKKAEEELAAARAKRIEDERAYNDALFEYLAAQKQKGEQLREAIARFKEETYSNKKGAALDQASMLESNASVLLARASQTTDINAAAGLNREAGLMQIQADVTNQLSAIDDLARSGRFANSQIEQLRNNVLEIGQIRIDGLKDQFRDLGGVISQEAQSAFGNFLTAVLTGSQTAGEALRGLVNQLLQALANLAIKQLLGGIFGGGGLIPGMASGSGGLIGDSFKRERQQSGGAQPRLIVANDREMVLNPKQSQEYLKLKSAGVLNFAAGSMPTLPSSTTGIGNNIVNIPVTVNGNSKESGLNSPAFKREVESAVTAIIIKHQSASGGLLKNR